MMASMHEPYDDLNASLKDFVRATDPNKENRVPRGQSIPRGSSSPPLLPSSEPATDLDPFEDDPDSDSDSAAGGYSPPAWRRLGNGDRSSGFWRGPRDDKLAAMPPLNPSSRFSSPAFDSDDEADSSVLDRAIRTQLPRGSQSPEKGRSPSPEIEDERTLRVDLPEVSLVPREAPTDNYVRFALRAELQHGVEPMQALYKSFKKYYTAATSTWLATTLSLLVVALSISMVRVLMEPASRRPTGDLVRVAGVAKSFEPLIYYSESAVLQVHELQATSVAVWDLSESIRSSDLQDTAIIVADLDALSETMKTLSIEMTKFFARVDGDIDGILNVMDWAKVHLKRFQTSNHPTTISAAYDNFHNMLSSARIFEDSTGASTVLGSATTYVFGLSSPQREQRLVQRLFTEFITVLEESIQTELQHSVTLFALFEAVDQHFLNLARTVVRETSTQEELHADMLSGLWVRILGAHADKIRKFEQNRKLLHGIRDKTVRNKHTLATHQSKLLALQTSLENLRGKLVSPLVRGVNATQLTLEDQIHGLSSVSEYLTSVRAKQKGKVMETLFASSPAKRFTIEDGQVVLDGSQPV